MNFVLTLNHNQEEILDKYNTLISLNLGPGMVGGSHNSNRSTGVPNRPINNSTFLDAPNQGWRMVLNGYRGLMVRTPKEATHHINYLKFLTAFLAIKAFGKTWQNITVLLRMDNITAVSYINQKRGSVQSSVPVSNNNLDVVHGEEYHPPSRTPSSRPIELIR